MCIQKYRRCSSVAVLHSFRTDVKTFVQSLVITHKGKSETKQKNNKKFYFRVSQSFFCYISTALFKTVVKFWYYQVAKINTVLANAAHTVGLDKKNQHKNVNFFLIERILLSTLNIIMFRLRSKKNIFT